MGQSHPSSEYRYKLRLTVEKTGASRPSFLLNKHQLLEMDSTQSPEIRAIADYSRAHGEMTDQERYVLAFSLLTARQILGGASHVSSRFDALKACLDDIERDAKA